MDKCRVYQYRKKGCGDSVIDFASGERAENFLLPSEIDDGDLFYIPHGSKKPEILCSFNSAIYKFIEKLNRAGISPIHNVETMAELQEILSNGIVEDESLYNMEDIPFVTIDNDGSRDLDQAVYVEECFSGYRIVYALADASFFITPGSSIFNEALGRGASFYFPDYAVPMLPRELSEGLISLNCGERRRAIVFNIQIDLNGNVLKTEISRSFIRSREKLSYSQVQEFYDSGCFGYLEEDIVRSLQCLQDAGRLLHNKFLKRGVVNYHRHELDITLCDNGLNFNVSNTKRSDAAKWNEQVSLLCNMEGAREIASISGSQLEVVQPVFRIHEPPSEKSLERLKKIIDDLIELHSLDKEEWDWGYGGGESLAVYLDRLPRSGKNKAVTETIEQQILVTNRKSVYSTEPEGHYALCVDLYGRFSSPMREIVGVFTHKELLEKIGLEENISEIEDILLREKVIDAGNRSKDIQKDMDRMIFDLVLEDIFSKELSLPENERSVFSGTVLGVKSSRIYVRMDSPAVEVKIYTETLNSILSTELQLGENSLQLVMPESGEAVVVAGGKIEFVTGKFSENKWVLVPTKAAYADIERDFSFMDASRSSFE